MTITKDQHGNTTAVDGFSICECGCKYWESNRCIDCGQGHSTWHHGGLILMDEEVPS